MNRCLAVCIPLCALLATAAVAQPAPPPATADAGAASTVAPPPPPPPSGPLDDGPPPPPRGPRGDRPPPPPRGPGIVIDRGQGGTYHLDVRCGAQETMRECATFATQFVDKLNAGVQPK